MIKDGNVAVLISRGYGAGWYTWNMSLGEELLFSPELVTAILVGASEDQLIALAKSLFPDAFYGGVQDLDVEWIPVGKRFKVNEYSGQESLILQDGEDWIIA